MLYHLYNHEKSRQYGPLDTLILVTSYNAIGNYNDNDNNDDDNGDDDDEDCDNSSYK
jgi:hypothetical protein